MLGITLIGLCIFVILYGYAFSVISFRSTSLYLCLSFFYSNRGFFAAASFFFLPLIHGI